MAHEYLMYGIDIAGAIVSTERFAGVDEAEVRRIATERLERYPMIEVWDGAICMIRLRRPSAGR